MDFTTRWDLKKREGRARAWKYVEDNKPDAHRETTLYTFIQLPHLAKWTDEKETTHIEAAVHIKFAASL